MNCGIKRRHIDKIRAVFAHYPKVEKVILYGSRARGNYHNSSDIDLTMIGKDLDLSVQFKIETELDDLLLPYQIDLSTYHQIDSEELLEHISRVGKPFYQKDNHR